jgi:integrase
MLQAVMGFAVLHGAVPYNPVKAVRKPRQLSRTVRPLAAQTVEAIRRQVSLRDATLVSVLAYAGLRPGEALGLRRSSVRKRTLMIQCSVSYGREKSTKTVLYARADEAKAESEGFGSTKPSRRRDSNPRPPLYESGALAN